MFVPCMTENKSAPIELVSRSEFFFCFFNIDLVTRKRKNKSLTMELVTRKVTYIKTFMLKHVTFPGNKT